MAMGKKWSIITCKGVALLALFVIIFGWPANGFSADLLLFAGAGLRQPTDRLIQTFQKETGNTVRVTYAGSGQLM